VKETKMRTRGYLIIVGALLALGAGGVVGAEGDKQPYAVPEAKRQTWETLKAAVAKDHAVCVEHCGAAAECLEKCKKAYEHRLKIEHQRLLYEK
jgi:hypothetical protein